MISSSEAGYHFWVLKFTTSDRRPCLDPTWPVYASICHPTGWTCRTRLIDTWPEGCRGWLARSLESAGCSRSSTERWEGVHGHGLGHTISAINALHTLWAAQNGEYSTTPLTSRWPQRPKEQVQDVSVGGGIGRVGPPVRDASNLTQPAVCS